MENLLPLIIFGLIAAISTWLKKRRAAQEHDWELPPSTSNEEQAPPAKNWEEQMRQLLAGQAPTPPSPPAPPPIPVPTRSAGTPVSPKIIVTRPAPKTQARAPLPPPVPRPTPVRGAEKPDLLAVARATHEQARRVDARVKEQLKAVSGSLGDRRQAGTRADQRSAGARAMRLISDRDGLRAAVLASVILGPPKALE